MNIKAENFKSYLAKNNINYFKIENEDVAEETDKNNNDAAEKTDKVIFHTYVKVFGQKLPAVVIFDDSIYTVLRLQVIPDITYTKNHDGFMKCVNEMNISYKAVKYYLGSDNALYLDMYISSLVDEIDGDLVINMLNAITTHLEKEYPNWMKLLWL